MSDQNNLTEDEAALYDRQIRLWGLDAQRRLRAARVLLIGVGGLGAEVAKNIVLAGVKSLTLLDHENVSSEDFCCQFFVSRDDAGKNRAESSLKRTQLLNPMVTVTADTEKISDKKDEFFEQFDVICATRCDKSTLFRLNEICTKNNTLFYAGDVFGQVGFMFADLQLHEYVEEIPKTKKKDKENEEPPEKKQKPNENDDETVVVKKACQFTRLKKALEYDWSSSSAAMKLKRTPNTYFMVQVLLSFLEKHGRRPAVKTIGDDQTELTTIKIEYLDSVKISSDKITDEFTKLCFAELSPVSAIVGGVLGQEIIKAVSKKDQPHNNFFFYSGLDGSGIVDQIG